MRFKSLIAILGVPLERFAISKLALSVILKFNRLVSFNTKN